MGRIKKQNQQMSKTEQIPLLSFRNLGFSSRKEPNHDYGKVSASAQSRWVLRFYMQDLLCNRGSRQKRSDTGQAGKKALL
jgi:hypothetical protein